MNIQISELSEIAKLHPGFPSLQFVNEANYRDPLLTESLSRDISNMCVTCHKEVNKNPIFKLPKRTTLFGEYMHQAAGNLDLALAMSEDQSMSEKAQEHIQLVDYYLGLLAPIFPESGPNFVIVDRELFQKRVAEIKKAIKKEDKPFTTADLKQSIESINSLCVTCHGQRD